MAVCPFATYRPVSNHSGPMTAHLGFVVHVQVGTGSCYPEFDNPTSQASSHFWCAADGTFEQYVDTDLIAWAEMAGNGQYVSCETEGTPDTGLTSAQITSLARLYVWLHQTHGIPFQTCDHGGQGITTHCFYPSGAADPNWGGHPCPGPLRLAQVSLVLAEAQRLTLPASPAPTVQHKETPVFIIVTTDTKAQYLVFANGHVAHIASGALGSGLTGSGPAVPVVEGVQADVDNIARGYTPAA